MEAIFGDEIPREAADIRSGRAGRIARLANVLDQEFKLPVLGTRVGLDGVIGLIPGIGDAITGALGGYLIVEAAQGGARKRVLAKMGLNTLIDSTLGSIPVLGDLFDFAFRSNAKNARLALEE